MSYFDLADSFISSFEETHSYLFACIFLNPCLDFANRDLHSDSVHVHHIFVAWRNELFLLR